MFLIGQVVLGRFIRSTTEAGFADIAPNQAEPVVLVVNGLVGKSMLCRERRTAVRYA